MTEKEIGWVFQTVPNINDVSDLVGRGKNGELIERSFLFKIRCKRHGRELSLDEDIISVKQIKRKQRYIYKLFQLIGPAFLHGMKIKRVNISDLPNDRPIIFAPNHAFTEDIVTSILLGDKHGLLIFGSLPAYFNTLDGAALSFYGTILINRNNKESRGSLVDKAEALLKNGGNILLYPEGVWNKTANRLTIDFWSGIFWIAKKANALIIPEVLLPVDKTIYCSRLEAFDISGYDDSNVKEALNDLRTIMNTELYSLMEKYAHTTREEIIGNCKSMTEAGEKFFQERVNSVGKYYDYPMEISADYQPKDIIREVDVWKPIANIQPTKENLLHYLYAKDRVAILEREDYQHRI